MLIVRVVMRLLTLRSVTVAASKALFCRSNCARWTFRSDVTWKTNMSIHRIPEYCENLALFGSSFKNMAQEIFIWQKWW